jgi:hypothetical protein
MDTKKINFRCPADVVETIDHDAKKDHRDRTSMLNKIIAFYYENQPPKNGDKPTTKKKAGSR